MSQGEGIDDLQHYLDQRDASKIEANPELAEAWEHTPPFINPFGVPLWGALEIKAVEENDG